MKFNQSSERSPLGVGAIIRTNIVVFFLVFFVFFFFSFFFFSFAYHFKQAAYPIHRIIVSP